MAITPTLLIPFLAQHVPSVFGWAAGLLAKVLIGEKAKTVLKDRSQRRAYLNAVGRAFSDFAKAFPDLAASFFDEYFLRSVIADEMLKFLSREQVPDKGRIIEAYGLQFGAPPSGDISAAVDAFLHLVERHCKSEKPLQSLLNSRQTEDSNRILRRLEDGYLNSAPIALPLQFSLDEARPIHTENVISAFKMASQELLSWPQLLEGKHWIERPELMQLMGRLESTNYSVSILIGAPGSGKSALLSRLAERCINCDWAVLAIKADQLPEELATLDEMQAICELPAPVVSCIRDVAKTKKVVLLIDQLDALSELIDLKTERLKILLRLVSQVREIESVHVVFSCRVFDRNYDKRLSSIEAEDMQLELPAWEAIETLLQEKSIKSNGWPQAFREILRVPQCLKLFLLHFSGTAELSIFESYQAMLERLWSDRLFGSSSMQGAAELLYGIATEMAEREVMFVAAAKYDNSRKALDYVVGAGVLQYDRTGRQISFTHQTLFDFARARAFIANEQSLSRYVLKRQSGLFVRPKLWSALYYLRGSDPTTYESELVSIWSAEGLRSHIRMLLIDFVGLQEPPSDTEVQLLRPAFSDQTYAPNVLAAIAGRRGWFEVARFDLIPAAMRGSPEMAWATTRTLEAAWSFAPEIVLDLIKAHWLRDAEKRNYAWHTLRGLQQWTRPALDIALAVVEREDLNNNSVHDLATLISATAPDLAPELVAAQIGKQVDMGMKSRQPIPEHPPGESDEERMIAVMNHHDGDPLRKILESHNEWYELAAIAEAAPKAYLAHVWPHVRRILEAVSKEDSTHFVTYREDHLAATTLEIEQSRVSYEHPLMDSFVYAICTLAKQDFASFRDFLKRNEGSDSMTVQRLLALGLCEVAELAPQFVLDYVLGDKRRLSLENFHEDERETKMLLRALVPYLAEADCRRLEQYILNAELHRDAAAEKNPKDRQRLAKYTRQFRLRLLLQFPKEKLSKETQDFIDSEKRIFSGFRDERREVEMLASKSAMKADAMQQATTETLEKFLTAFPDSTEWGDQFRSHGGSIEVSREFAQFAKLNTQKAMSLIGVLDPRTHQRPAAYAIRELTETELSDEALFELVLSLDAKGFDGEEFRQCVASSFRKRVKSTIGLPDAVIDLLERWLGEYVIEKKEGEVDHEAKSTDRKESHLWGYGGTRILPNGSYPLLDAIFFGLIAREPIPSKRLLNVLAKQLARGDRIEVWDALGDDTLKRVRYCEHDAAQAFLNDLFNTHPQLLGRHSGAFLIAYGLTWVSPDLTKSWIKQVATSKGRRARQTYGELLALRAVLLKDDSWSRGEIATIIAQATSGSIDDSLPLCGLVYGAANLWKDAEDRSLLKVILCSGMNSLNKDVARAAMDWFRVTGALQFDAETQSILEAFVTGNSLDIAGTRSYALDHVGDLIDQAPDLVYRVSKRLLDIFKADVGNLASNSALEAESLVSIALTLQRQEEPYRTRGLELFEQLLKYNAYKARDVLMDIDRRPGSAIPAIQLRRRRRKRAASAR